MKGALGLLSATPIAPGRAALQYGNLKMLQVLIGVAILSRTVRSVTLTEHTFCRPTRDSVFKHVLNDERVRKSFICALSPFKNVVSSDLMDSDLRPLAGDENLLNALKNENFQAFVKSSGHLTSSSALFSICKLPCLKYVIIRNNDVIMT